MPNQTPVGDTAEGAVANAQSAHGSGDGSSKGVTSQTPNAGGGTQDADKLLKRVEDLQKQISRFQSERDSALSENKKLNEQLLTKMGDILAKQQPDTSVQDRQAQLKALAAELDENMTGEKLVTLLDQMARDAKHGALSDFEKALKERDAKINNLENMLGEVDPQWQSVKGKVEELGLRDKFPNADRRQLIQIVEVLNAALPSGPAQPDVPPSPGTVGGGVHVGSDDGAMSTEAWSALEMFSGRKLTDAQKQQLERKWRAK